MIKPWNLNSFKFDNYFLNRSYSSNCNGVAKLMDPPPSQQMSSLVGLPSLFNLWPIL